MAPTSILSFIFGLVGVIKTVNGFNFAIAESDTIINLSGGVSTTQDLIFISDGSESPGCCQWDKSSPVAGFPIPNDNSSGFACGVFLDFYKNGNNYVYFQHGGDGTELGECTSNNAPLGQTTASCLGFGSVNTIFNQYSCTNHNQNVNGVNPCTPQQAMNTSC
ncbi:hypothetical protein V8C37DRAFT_167461 [Trichoderma ceciliae]